MEVNKTCYGCVKVSGDTEAVSVVFDNLQGFYWVCLKRPVPFCHLLTYLYDNLPTVVLVDSIITKMFMGRFLTYANGCFLCIDTCPPITKQDVYRPL